MLAADWCKGRSGWTCSLVPDTRTAQHCKAANLVASNGTMRTGCLASIEGGVHGGLVPGNDTPRSCEADVRSLCRWLPVVGL